MADKYHHRTSPEGRKIGGMMARIADRGREILASQGLVNMRIPTVRDEMCASCACRAGTVPNGCLQTMMDFTKSVTECTPFLCHAPMDGRMCAGWIAVRAATVDAPIPEDVRAAIAAWEYSPPDEPEMPHG